MRALLFLSILLGASCGEPLVGAEYRGSPIFKLSGQVLARRALPDELLEETFIVSIFWARGGLVIRPDLSEQRSVTTQVSFPATFELRVFEPPTDDLFGSADESWIVGLALVYVDTDRDGRFSSGTDTLIGGSTNRGLLFARAQTDAENSPTGAALEAGFSLLDLPVEASCGDVPLARGVSPPEGLRNFAGSCTSGCRPGFVCDVADGTCAVAETFTLFVDTGFTLAALLCRG